MKGEILFVYGENYLDKMPSPAKKHTHIMFVHISTVQIIKKGEDLLLIIQR
jgi:hypothetical protein